LLSNCRLNCVYCELFTEGNVGFGMDFIYVRIYVYMYLFIWKFVDVCTGYVVADREGNMNIGQYHSS